MSRAGYLLKMLSESRDSIMEHSFSHSEVCIMTGKPSKQGLPQFDNLDRICRDVILEQQSPKFLAKLMGIKKDGDKWVHPLVGVVEGIDECETQNDVVCRLLETKRHDSQNYAIVGHKGETAGSFGPYMMNDGMSAEQFNEIESRKK